MSKPRKKSRNVKKGNFNGYWPFVATPAYDGKVNSEFAQSMVEAAYASPLMATRITFSCLRGGAFIDLARNQFAKTFLEDNPECTHLFFIDSDLAFPPDIFVGLVNLNLPVVAGVYRKREDEETYPVRWQEAPTGGLWCKDNFIMANRVPTGFLCIRRDIVEEMSADADKLTIPGTEGTVARLFRTEVITNDKGELNMIGEDFCWCDDYVKKYDKPIPVWPDCDFSHDGYTGNLAKHLNDQLSELEDESGSSAA